VADRGTFLLFDDAMISMTYARNLAEGHGLAWGDGQRVEGYSNLLWTLLMSGAHLLPLRDATTALVVMIGGALILGRLRPEVVTELWYPNNRELCQIAAGGYRQVAPAFFVRSGAAGIHPALARDIRSHAIRAPVPAPSRCG